MSETFTLTRLLTEAAEAAADHADTHANLNTSITLIRTIIESDRSRLDETLASLHHRLIRLEQNHNHRINQP